MNILITRQAPHRREQIEEIAREVFGPLVSITRLHDTCPISDDSEPKTPVAAALQELGGGHSTVEAVVRSIVGINPDVIVTRNMTEF